MQNKAIQPHKLRVGDFRPMLPAYQRAKEAQRWIEEDRIISYTKDYGDAFLTELRKSYPDIPMHRKFSKREVDVSSSFRVGREVYNLTYYIREGHKNFFPNLLYMISPFTKELITLRRIPLDYPKVIIHDKGLQRQENVENIQRIINELNRITPIKFILDRSSLEDYIHN